jgi:hypothetical protein
MPEGEAIRTVNLNLGNAAEVNMVAVNAAHIAYVKLSGSMNSLQRKMEVHLSDGEVVGMNFDDPEHAERIFTQVIDTINRTIPDHLAQTPIVVPQASR